MTSRDRYNAWLLGKSDIIETRLEVWQAAERDMLERCVKVLEDDAARQRAEWDARIALDLRGYATDYSSIPRAYADKFKELAK